MQSVLSLAARAWRQTERKVSMQCFWHSDVEETTWGGGQNDGFGNGAHVFHHLASRDLR